MSETGTQLECFTYKLISDDPKLFQGHTCSIHVEQNFQTHDGKRSKSRTDVKVVGPLDKIIVDWVDLDALEKLIAIARQELKD